MITKNLNSFLNFVSYVGETIYAIFVSVKRHNIVQVQCEYGLLPV